MKGKVYLVGAGPGEFGLITVKGLNFIKKADVIVYDRLANKALLNEAKDGCRFIYVGKESNNHTKTQDEINDIIYKEALNGNVVTRLKGGDPYVFGRGGEEGEYLFDRGINFEVVPGITSAIGGLCYAGIPITHRECASSFHVITGHLKNESDELNWKALSQLDGTLVFLMGMSNLNKICSKLMENGKNRETPVAIINWAARPYQKVVEGNLSNIHDIVIREGIKSPSLIVVGEVVQLRNKLNFYESKPLFGKNIVITRSRAQNSDLVNRISELGGNAIEFPTIKIEEIKPNNKLSNSIEHIEEYNYIIFTSENGVKIFFDNLFKKGYDARRLYDKKIVCIGKGTAKALKQRGLVADIIPERFVAESIVEELNKVLKKTDKILIPRAKQARKYLVDELKKICSVDEVHIYDTVKDTSESIDVVNRLREGTIDYVTFTSSSTVKNFMDILEEENREFLKNIKFISIGPITTKTIESYGFNVYKEAKEYSIDGIMEVL